MIDGAAGKAIAESFAKLIKWGGIALLVFVPLGAWKAIELMASLF